jgi:hypothetical protein
VFVTKDAIFLMVLGHGRSMVSSVLHPGLVFCISSCFTCSSFLFMIEILADK